jgi:hypothetical protein
MTVISADRPDPRYYIQIIQHDDGNWESQPMPLDDIVVPARLGIPGFSMQGLRSVTKTNVNHYAEDFITNHAPPFAQSNALYVLSSQTSGTAVDDANAMFTWINAVRAESNTLSAQIDTMTFDQIVVFNIPAQPWPAPPPSIA